RRVTRIALPSKSPSRCTSERNLQTDRPNGSATDLELVHSVAAVSDGIRRARNGSNLGTRLHDGVKNAGLFVCVDSVCLFGRNVSRVFTVSPRPTKEFRSFGRSLAVGAFSSGVSSHRAERLEALYFHIIHTG